MIKILRYLPALLAFVRWDLTKRDGPLAALLCWVAVTNWMRWEFSPLLGSDPLRWAVIDLLWISWYVAHRLTLDRAKITLLLAALTGVIISYNAFHYVTVERWMAEDSLREVILQALGVLWSAAGLLSWLRYPSNLGRVLGSTSAGLSVVQILNIWPNKLVGLCPALFSVVLTMALSLILLMEITNILKPPGKTENSHR